MKYADVFLLASQVWFAASVATDPSVGKGGAFFFGMMWPVLRLSIYLSPRRLWRVEGEPTHGGRPCGSVADSWGFKPHR